MYVMLLLGQVREVLRQDILLHSEGGWGNNRLKIAFYILPFLPELNSFTFHNSVTGCKVPCTYQHYSLVDNPFTLHTSYAYFSLSYISTDVTLEEEVLCLLCQTFYKELKLSIGFWTSCIWRSACYVINPGAYLPPWLTDQRVWRSSWSFPRILLSRLLCSSARPGGKIFPPNPDNKSLCPMNTNALDLLLHLPFLATFQLDETWRQDFSAILRQWITF